MCFSGVLWGENIINTLSGSCCVDKMAVCVIFFILNHYEMIICPYVWN